MFKLAGFTKQSSSFVESIYVDVIDGTCTVWYDNNTCYDYTNVSRRALFNVLNNDQVSLGFFVNTHLLAFNCKAVMKGSSKREYWSLTMSKLFLPA